MDLNANLLYKLTKFKDFPWENRGRSKTTKFAVRPVQNSPFTTGTITQSSHNPSIVITLTKPPGDSGPVVTRAIQAQDTIIIISLSTPVLVLFHMKYLVGLVLYKHVQVLTSQKKYYILH